MSGRGHTALRGSLVAALFVAAPAAALTGRAAEVRRLLADWQVDEAARVLARLEAEGPDTPVLQELRGLLAFHRGQYTAALAELRAAAARLPSPPRRLRDAMQLVASTAELVQGYVERKSAEGHFTFRAPPGRDELLIPFAGETLEATRARLKEDLGYAPAEPILVEIYPSADDLARVSSLTVAEIRRTGTVALCKYNRLMIITPRALLRGYGWRDTLAHEYAHLIIGRVSRNRTPVWLHEGLAKQLEARWRSSPEQAPPLSLAQEHLLATALRGRSRLIPWSAMHPSMAKLPSQAATALAFAQAQTAVAYIVQHHTHAALRRLLELIGAGKPAWGAVEQVTALSRARFQEAFERHLRGLKLRRLTGFVPLELRFGKPPTKEQQRGQIRQERARDLFRLADMLRQRKLMRAAILEYKKARAIVGQRDAVVSNALARTYLEVGSADQALNAVLPVLEYYPELPGAQVTAGVAYLRSGNRAAAERHLKVALRINPFDPELHCGLARAIESPQDAQRHAQLCAALGR